ncbi:uncharacterized protein MYCFIDRAFT_212396 [Pseudocercospora fijiensis CIRAD86]|uniref:Uncharacterized protein n=1 Tax=Pseudocercospora fijiensis (strain CIRAD86) TaxID=383855 RepID=M3ALY5_PSEFD|nr:uncharacterized protein MYCFIDRAFT_212396 [Pseudocercospora fijiensis CIRAD86]EME78482.1 hypothetical protein MYCFIDRAFT_212396 [Pseudocercospora fijiensis CIRAD86]
MMLGGSRKLPYGFLFSGLLDFTHCCLFLSKYMLPTCSPIRCATASGANVPTFSDLRVLVVWRVRPVEVALECCVDCVWLERCEMGRESSSSCWNSGMGPLMRILECSSTAMMLCSKWSDATSSTSSTASSST